MSKAAVSVVSLLLVCFVVCNVRTLLGVEPVNARLAGLERQSMTAAEIQHNRDIQTRLAEVVKELESQKARLNAAR